MVRGALCWLLLCGTALAQPVNSSTLSIFTSPAFTGTATTPDLIIAGTSNLAGAWTATTGAVTAGSGTLTTATSTIRYIKVGRTVTINIDISIPNNGTGASNIVVQMPFVAAGNQQLNAAEIAVNGYVLRASIPAGGSYVTITRFDNIYPASSGCRFILSGSYEAAS